MQNIVASAFNRSFFWAAPPVLQSERDKNNGASLIDKVGGRSIPRISYPRIPTRKNPGQKKCRGQKRTKFPPPASNNEGGRP